MYRSVHTEVVKPVARLVIRPEDTYFPAVDPLNVYQGGAGLFVETVSFPSNAGSFNFDFELFVSSHNQTLRGLVGQTDGFLNVDTAHNWNVSIHPDDELKLSIRDDDAPSGTLVSVSVSCPVNVWLDVSGWYDATTGELSIGCFGAITSIIVPNRLEATNDTPFRVLGSPTEAFAEGCQISNIRISDPLTAMVNWPCAEGENLLMKDYVAKNILSPTNGTLSSTSIHATRAIPV